MEEDRNVGRAWMFKFGGQISVFLTELGERLLGGLQACPELGHHYPFQGEILERCPRSDAALFRAMRTSTFLAAALGFPGLGLPVVGSILSAKGWSATQTCCEKQETSEDLERPADFRTEILGRRKS